MDHDYEYPLFNSIRVRAYMYFLSETERLRCQLMHFFENIKFYIVIPPSKYDNKEILRLQGSVEGPKILRFRFS